MSDVSLVINHNHDKNLTEEKLLESKKWRKQHTIVIKKGSDVAGIRHPSVDRLIHFHAQTLLVIIHQSKHLLGANIATNGFTCHFSMREVIRIMKKLLNKRETVYAMDKLGNIYTLSLDKLHYYTNIYGKGA